MQIDESAFGKTQKYRKGKYYKKRWIFRISQPSKHKCLLVPVEKRDAKTLLDIICKYVDTGSNMKVVSDGWAAYNTLAQKGYQHSVVVHKEEFVNASGEHTNSIESVWSQFKTWISNMHEHRNDKYDEYINEFMFRYNFCGGNRNDCFPQFIRELR